MEGEIYSIGKFKLGKKYRYSDGKVFKVIGLCEEPSVVLESDDGERLSFGIGGLIGRDLEEVKDDNDELKTLKDIEQALDMAGELLRQAYYRFWDSLK
jgi:hypothetical protein